MTKIYIFPFKPSPEKEDCNIFIEFMLQEILKTLKVRYEKSENTQENTQEKILILIREQPELTRRELASMLGKTEDSIKYHLLKLTQKGIIKHVGSTKGGKWIIIEK